jgi:hypothetical protein
MEHLDTAETLLRPSVAEIAETAETAETAEIAETAETLLTPAFVRPLSASNGCAIASLKNK